ncbi:MAG TPA: peptidase M23 [Micromonosporaceae bacterium]
MSAGLLVLLSPTAGQAAAPAAGTTSASVEATVTSELLERARGIAGYHDHTADQTRVTVTKRSGRTWAFGTAILLAPHEEGVYPEGWLFLAKRSIKGWQVAFEDDAAFATLAAAAPLLGRQERANLTSASSEVSPSYANGDYRTGMRLPFATGVSWTLTGGPHSSPVWSSIDMAGGDQVVRAARGGTAYTMCKGWLRVIHDRGYATDYYHLWNNISVNGAAVAAGARLGDTGTDVTCGGSATGRHVHFALRQNNAFVPIQYHIIGKWIIYAGSSAYGGYAMHGSTRVNVGGALYNYGALGFDQGIVDTNGGTSLNKRSGPGTSYSIVGSVADGATVTIVCSKNGTTHTGRFGSTSLWNKLSDGSWVSDAYLATGSNGPVSGYC